MHSNEPTQVKLFSIMRSNSYVMPWQKSTKLDLVAMIILDELFTHMQIQQGCHKSFIKYEILKCIPIST
jgi:hypothetical protein